MTTKDKVNFNKKQYLADISTANGCLSNMKKNLSNPAFVNKIEEMQRALSWLTQHIDNEVKYRKAEMNSRPLKPNTKKPKPIHFGSPGRNATRRSGQHNDQGGLRVNSRYHKKDYED